MTDAHPPLAATLLREVVRTPAARELLAELLRPPGNAEMAALTEALLAEDPELALRGLVALPQLANATLGAVDALGRLLEPLPPPLLAQVLLELADRFDGEALRATGLRWVRLLGRMTADEELRGVVTRGVARATTAALRHLARGQGWIEPAVVLAGDMLAALDFGQLRVAAEAVGQASGAALPRLVERITADPVLVANLVQCAPPLVNTALALAAHAMGTLRLPPEVLASALFNLLESLDTRAVARLVDALGGLIASAHEGSLILGRHEPRLRQVLTRLLFDLAGRIDRRTAGRAAAALAEDLETALGVCGDLLCAEPELLLHGVAATTRALEAALRGTVAGLEQLAGLPDATLDLLEQEVEAGLGRLWDLLQREGRLDPLWRRLVRPALRVARARVESFDSARTGRALGQVACAISATVARQPRALDAALSALDRPGARRDLEDNLRQLGAGIAARPQLLRALLRPVMAGAQHAVMDYVRTLPSRLRGRGR